VSIGPVEMIVLGFPGNQFTGEIAPALADLVETGLIRIIDLVFVTKDEAGNVAAIELSDIDESTRVAFESVVAELTGLVSEEDVEDLAADLEPDNSAAILIFEHAWASTFVDAVRESGGELLTQMRIPREVIDEVTTAIETQS
jgi:hypothetical protein